MAVTPAAGSPTRPVPARASTDRRPTTEGRRARPHSVWLARLESPLAAYYLILGAFAVLLVIGLVMVLSSSSVGSFKEFQNLKGNSYAVFAKQATFAAVGLPLAWLASRVPVRTWTVLAWPLLGVSALSLLAVALIGVGFQGNKNWIMIGPFMMQPSEAAKLTLVVWGAAVLTRKRPLLGSVGHVVVPVVPGALLLLGLVMVGSDLGTALVLVAITAGVLFTAGVPVRYLLSAAAAAAVVIAILVVTSAHRMERVQIWLGLKPLDPHDSGLQIQHGLWGLATGGWWGVGLGASREKWSWLPEAHNDYIFAVIGEELGLAGTLAVIALFVALALGLYRLLVTADEPFVAIAAGGVLTWISVQAIVNIGSVTGALPVIGVPLPLVSSGGSALIMTMVALGMMLGFARQVPGAPEALAARPRLTHRVAAVLPRRGGRRR